jgi:hypothetical protein
MPLIGEWAMGTAVIGLAFLVLARIGVGRWEAWDLAERQGARQLVPQPVSGWRPLIAFGLLTAAAVAMSAATFAYLWR